MPRRPVQLELFSADPQRPDLWSMVDSLNERAAAAHLGRKKLVKPKARQSSLLDEPVAAPADK